MLEVDELDYDGETADLMLEIIAENLLLKAKRIIRYKYELN